MNTSKITIRGLYKIFGNNPHLALEHVRQGVDKDTLLKQHRHVLALDNINLDLQERNIEVIMGLSGSGKSTLIRHLNRLLEPTTGTIHVDGDDVTTMNTRQLRRLRQHKITMVFQKFALLPHRTVLENITFGLRLSRDTPTKDITQKAYYWLNRVDLKGVEHYYPAQLSGGMQQRVGLARALATDCDILLMDEAFSALDPLIRTDMQDMLLDLQSELHKTIVFITHDLDEALRLGDRIAILKDGALVQQGNAQYILLRPADDYVRRFVADVNRIKVLRVEALMQTNQDALATNTPDADSLTVTAGSDVQTLISCVLVSNPTSIWVVNDAGEKLGHISRKALAQTVVAEPLRATLQ